MINCRFNIREDIWLIKLLNNIKMIKYFKLGVEYFKILYFYNYCYFRCKI